LKVLSFARVSATSLYCFTSGTFTDSVIMSDTFYGPVFPKIC
jgi:hypothetical protein